MTAPHALVADEVARRLGTDTELGLGEAEAEARLAEVGPNRLERAARPAYARIALRQFVDPLVGLLIVAAVVSAALGEGVEAAVIGAIVVLNALLGFVQEAAAERAVLALREVLERPGERRPRRPRARGGGGGARPGRRRPRARRANASPPTPAWRRSRGLEVDESALTGESRAGRQGGRCRCRRTTPLADRTLDGLRGHGRDPRPRPGARHRDRAGAPRSGDRRRSRPPRRRPPTPLQRRVRQRSRA